MPAFLLRSVKPMSCTSSNRLGRRRKLVAVDQQLGDGPAHEAGEDEAEGGAGDADLHGVGDALVR